MTTYQTIAKTIEYIKQNPNKSDLETLSRQVHMNKYDFQKTFSKWAGVSPHKFAQYITKEYVKALLEDSNNNLLDVTYESGLSSPGRLHDLMVTYEAVSPGEFKSKDFKIDYGFHETPFGKCLIGVTKRGVCYLSFVTTSDDDALKSLSQTWKSVELLQNQESTKHHVNEIFSSDISINTSIHLLVKGTNFQIKVWEALLKIPFGKAVSYKTLASISGNPKASRAVGSACGANHISYLIPCHRVLRSDGDIGDYRWGTNRKEAILAWEGAQSNKTP